MLFFCYVETRVYVKAEPANLQLTCSKLHNCSEKSIGTLEKHFDWWFRRFFNHLLWTVVCWVLERKSAILQTNKLLLVNLSVLNYYSQSKGKQSKKNNTLHQRTNFFYVSQQTDDEDSQEFVAAREHRELLYALLRKLSTRKKKKVIQ